NWKLILDAFQELYHVPVLHARSVAKMFAQSITVESAIGHHMRFATARKEFRKMDVAASIQDIQNYVTFSYLIFPNTIVVVSPTFINLLISYPVDVDRTLVENLMLVPKLPETEEELLHYRRSWELLDENVYQREDLHAAGLQQKGLASGMLDTLV